MPLVASTSAGAVMGARIAWWFPIEEWSQVTLPARPGPADRTRSAPRTDPAPPAAARAAVSKNCSVTTAKNSASLVAPYSSMKVRSPRSARARRSRNARSHTSCQRRAFPARRAAVCRRRAVEHVQLVGELVIDEVVAVALARRRAARDPRRARQGRADGAPRRATRSVRSPPVRADARTRRLARLRPQDRARVHEDRLDVLVQAMRQLQHEHAGLRGYRDLHLLVELEAAAALPMLFRHEHLHQVAQALLRGGRSSRP